MGNHEPPEMPTVDESPTATQLIKEIFAEARRQEIRPAELCSLTGWEPRKIARIRRCEYIPKLDEYMHLCRAIGKSPRQIEDMARFHNTTK